MLDYISEYLLVIYLVITSSKCDFKISYSFRISLRPQSLSGMMPFIVTFTFKIMAMGNAFIGNYSNCFAAIGTLTVSYVALRLLYSIWKGVKVFLLARMFALGVNLKKTGSWAGKYFVLAKHPSDGRVSA